MSFETHQPSIGVALGLVLVEMSHTMAQAKRALGGLGGFPPGKKAHTIRIIFRAIISNLTQLRSRIRRPGSLGGFPHERSETRGQKYKAVMELYRRQRAERSEKTGVWGRIPQEVR
jgi:hypothetical protein